MSGADAGLDVTGQAAAREGFEALARALDGLLEGDEVYLASFSGEDSDFVRFNRGEVRQAGAVTQRTLTLDLARGRRHASGTLTLAGDLEVDRPRLARLVRDLREVLGHLPEDPFFLYATEPRSSERTDAGALPEGAAAVAAVQAAAQGRDLVGIWAAGAIHAGFASSLGQRNWYSTRSFNLDWSFYHRADKAVKAGYAGFTWDEAAFRRKVDWAGEQLRAVARPPRTISPGRYRVFLAPAAVHEVVSILCWDGFGLKAHRTKQTPFLKLVEGEARLDPRVTLVEHTAGGVAPNFQEQGFLRPDAVPLLRAGGYAECLVSPRSAQEYGVATNGASAGEAPESLDLAAGDLPQAGALARLDRGIWVGNLWYLNYSDRSACRTTGMTRFATFWVEGGEVVAPLDVMRFDETVYRMLGDNLVALTAERELILDANTYGGRSTSSARLPGALVDDFTFTL